MAFALNWPVRDGDIGTPEVQQTELGATVVDVAYVVLFTSALLSSVSIIVRYRQADGDTRRRLRWVLTGGVVIMPMVLATILGADQAVLLLALHPMLGVSLALAIWRDQLFDVDVFISRSLVYASTLAAIAGVYALVVFGVGSVLTGLRSDSSVLAVVAIVVVAVTVHPARVRLERLANRVVFGRRASPYEVLSTFTQGVAAADADLLADVARSVAEGTVATGAGLWSHHGGELELVSIWPDPEGSDPAAAHQPAMRDGEDRLVVPGADETFPVEHGGEVVGAIGIGLPARDQLPPADRKLITELAAGIGLALRNRELTADLRATVDALLASRRRLVAVQDATRHRLERDLHDGAQQRLVATKVRLSIARQMAERDGRDELAARLGRLCDRADEAVDSLRDFARGVYPPLLEAEGLGPALRALVDRLERPVELRLDDLDRQPREVEATVYFLVVEILQDPTTVAGRRVPVVVEITREADGVAVRIGPVALGRMPGHLADRVDALSGTFSVQAGADGGSTIRCRIPARGRWDGRWPIEGGEGDGMLVIAAAGEETGAR